MSIIINHHYHYLFVVHLHDILRNGFPCLKQGTESGLRDQRVNSSAAVLQLGVRMKFPKCVRGTRRNAFRFVYKCELKSNLVSPGPGDVSTVIDAVEDITKELPHESLFLLQLLHHGISAFVHTHTLLAGIKQVLHYGISTSVHTHLIGWAKAGIELWDIGAAFSCN